MVKKGIPVAPTMLKRAAKILETKTHDYGKRSKNFVEAGTVASIIRGKEIDALDVAAVMIGVKLSRLSSLTAGKGKEPKHESVIDTEIDCINYIALFEEVRQYMKDNQDNE